MRRGLLYDAYRTRSACLRWYHARLPGQVAQSGNSEPAVERTKPAELSRNTDPKHHECGVRVDQMRRGLLLLLSLSLSYIQETAGPKAFLMSWLALLEYF